MQGGKAVQDGKGQGGKAESRDLREFRDLRVISGSTLAISKRMPVLVSVLVKSEEGVQIFK